MLARGYQSYREGQEKSSPPAYLKKHSQRGGSHQKYIRGLLQGGRNSYLQLRTTGEISAQSTRMKHHLKQYILDKVRERQKEKEHEALDMKAAELRSEEEGVGSRQMAGSPTSGTTTPGPNYFSLKEPSVPQREMSMKVIRPIQEEDEQTELGGKHTQSKLLSGSGSTRKKPRKAEVEQFIPFLQERNKMGKSEIASVKHILIKEGAKSKITKAKLAAQQKYKLNAIHQCNPNSLRGLGLVPQ